MRRALNRAAGHPLRPGDGRNSAIETLPAHSRRNLYRPDTPWPWAVVINLHCGFGLTELLGAAGIRLNRDLGNA